MNGKRTTGLCGVALAGMAVLLAAAGEAQARPHPGRRHHGPAIILDGFFRPAPRVERRWVPGHYETRTERVLVREGHFEKRWIEPVTETRRDYHGRPYTVLVRPGRCEKVWVPPQYETRCVRVWVPDRPVETHIAPRPHVGYRIGIRF
jgi:hypothetical protein